MINGIERGPEFVDAITNSPEASAMIADVDASLATVERIVVSYDLAALAASHPQPFEDF